MTGRSGTECRQQREHQGTEEDDGEEWAAHDGVDAVHRIHGRRRPALIEAGAEVMNELADPIGFWAATTCRWARIVEAPPRFLAPELAEAFRRTPSPHLDDELPQVLPCFRLMLPDGALFAEDGVPIPVVIGADLRAMADWLPAEAKRISGISCVR